MTNTPTIMKFGGTSVEDPQAFRRVAKIVQAHAQMRPVIIVSAMSGVTDALLQSVQMAKRGELEQATSTLEVHFDRHLKVATSLLSAREVARLESAVESARRQICGLLRKVSTRMHLEFLEDTVVSYGERLSAELLAAVLCTDGLPAKHIDARRCITTEETHGGAQPLVRETEDRTRRELGPLVEAREIPVLGGFIAATKTGKTTTLGRGGSDYTAALIGAALRTREIQIWTDVSGVLTADPRLVRAARTIPCLSYREAAELAYFGAKVLHPKTIRPAVERGIPVRVCNSHRAQDEGTLIFSGSEFVPHTAKAIAHKTGITVLQITSARMLGAYGFLRTIFEIFDRHRTVVDVVTTSEVSVSLTLDDTRALGEILTELRGLGTVEVEERRAIICVVGEGLRTTPGVAARVFATISDINVSLVSLGASNVNLTFVIDEERVREAVARLHFAFFEQEVESVCGNHQSRTTAGASTGLL